MPAMNSIKSGVVLAVVAAAKPAAYVCSVTRISLCSRRRGAIPIGGVNFSKASCRFQRLAGRGPSTSAIRRSVSRGLPKRLRLLSTKAAPLFGNCRPNSRPARNANGCQDGRDWAERGIFKSDAVRNSGKIVLIQRKSFGLRPSARTRAHNGSLIRQYGENELAPTA